MKDKYALTREYNDEAHREIELAGFPRYVDPDGKRFSEWAYDSGEVWGIPNHELEGWIASLKRRWMRCLNPLERRRRYRYWLLWECREAASMGLSLCWM
jgi:hypothetical protein